MSLKCLPQKHDVGHSGRSKFHFGLKTLRSLYIRCWWDHICKSVQAVWGITDSGWPIQLVPCSRRKLIVSSLQSCSGTCRTLSQYVLVAIFRQSLAWQLWAVQNSRFSAGFQSRTAEFWFELLFIVCNLKLMKAFETICWYQTFVVCLAWN